MRGSFKAPTHVDNALRRDRVVLDMLLSLPARNLLLIAIRPKQVPSAARAYLKTILPALPGLLTRHSVPEAAQQSFKGVQDV